jgi:hypothetical protein
MEPDSQPPIQFESNDEIETNSHTFVLKVWVEEIVEETKSAHWRGRITHVLNGEHIYFEDLETLQHFLEAYLAKMHVDPASRR